MSGGHFNYQQYMIEEIASDIDALIATNDDETLDYCGSRRGKFYPVEVIEKFREAANTLRQAEDMVQCIDWLVSGDYGVETFLRQWGDKVRQMNVDLLGQVNKLQQEVLDLESWKKSAWVVLAEWEKVWEASGKPGTLGASKAVSVLESLCNSSSKE